MFIRTKIFLAEKTDIEDFQGNSFEDDAVFNTDSVDYFHKTGEGEFTLVVFRSGERFIAAIPFESFIELFDQYEIKIFDN